MYGPHRFRKNGLARLERRRECTRPRAGRAPLWGRGPAWRCARRPPRSLDDLGGRLVRQARATPREVVGMPSTASKRIGRGAALRRRAGRYAWFLASTAHAQRASPAEQASQPNERTQRDQRTPQAKDPAERTNPAGRTDSRRERTGERRDPNEPSGAGIRTKPSGARPNEPGDAAS
jgi:hypothetical protein